MIVVWTARQLLETCVLDGNTVICERINEGQGGPPPHGFTAKMHQMDARVGGTYEMSFKNFNTGTSHSFGGKFLELVPNERLRYTDAFDDPNLPGEMQTTVVLKKVSVGTEINTT
jgi:uncharacterized protein YndB with AHSA1/START domain